MQNKKDSLEAIKQNLQDAGCDEKTCDSFLNDYQKGDTIHGLKCLKRHRKGLLNTLHNNQKCIDCLDYLLYEIKKDEEEKDENN